MIHPSMDVSYMPSETRKRNKARIYISSHADLPLMSSRDALLYLTLNSRANVREKSVIIKLTHSTPLGQQRPQWCSLNCHIHP